MTKWNSVFRDLTVSTFIFFWNLLGMTLAMTSRSPRRLRELVRLRPRTPREVGLFCERVLGVKMPGLSAGEVRGPGAYLVHAYFERGAAEGGGDCVVWANRGGGKTMLGAVATVLDLLFKPGVQVRVLGGSLEQARKMYEHLTGLLDRPGLRGGGGVLAGEPTQREVRLAHGSGAAILAGSQRSVRGVRVQKLRCDEVEELDPEVWSAAQMTTRSVWCGDEYVRGTVEALSTMHRPFGLMSSLVGDAAARRVFRWNAMDVIARCEPERACDGCVLWDDCRGMAKRADGFIPVSDLVAQRERTGDRAWEAEMMCRRPSVSEVVYPEFSVERHVRAEGGLLERGRLQTASVESQISDSKVEISGMTSPIFQGGPLRLECDRSRSQQGTIFWVGGVDFGMRSPFVFLWAVVEAGGGTARERERALVHVVGEYAGSDLPLGEHLRRVGEVAAVEGWPVPGAMAWLGIDPAGGQRNSHSGQSDAALLRRAGCRVRAMRSRVGEGLRLIRRRLDHDTLLLHPRCERLIRAMQQYHFDPKSPQSDDPVKDGPDHLCDALRYLLVNLEACGGEVEGGTYL